MARCYAPPVVGGIVGVQNRSPLLVAVSDDSETSHQGAR